MTERHYLGIDIGGTNIVYAVVTADGKLIREQRMKTNPARRASEILHEVLTASQVWIQQDSLIMSVGIGLPGIVDAERGIARNCPNLGWTDVDVIAPVQENLAVPVLLENDVRCMALAERSFGAARGTDDSICIALGTGIGSGIFVRGELLRGTCGAAGEVGHMTIIPVGGAQCGCGNTGCWETLASGSAIVRHARCALEHAQRFNIPTALKEPLDGIKVADAAREWDSVAVAVLQEAGRFLGIGLANLVNLFNPECVVLGGGMALAGDALFIPAQQEMLRRVMVNPIHNVRIIPAELGSSAGAIGAAVLGLVKGA
ncbi:ROK family protein [Desulfosporosinus sp. Sb-LF]|uniref:ROK family protein n=1 Tax=Desulfosporosinus sp. Sb-LF TaxID=2560027 RepID=UPI001305090B|nr:ROK family protein [Desulfosporosinus sp. Sb-LF]